MALYEYQCVQHGVFEIIRPVGTAPDSAICSVCSSEAKRIVSVPVHFRGSRELLAAIDHAEKSRYEPEVVTSLPTTGVRKRTPVLPLTPTLKRLPRP